jgi:hypothetical protein
MGRSNAATGLLIDVSLLRGTKILESFEPTTKGAESALGLKTNSINPKGGVQAAVTLGAGTTADVLFKSLSPSKLFPMTAGHGDVSVLGGWGQFGGHGAFTQKFGLGVDQWLEAKVVTADGELKIVNKVSNPDLFWALRGGGGGSFGVVVEATIKVYPDAPITNFAWWINSTTPSSDDFQAATRYLVGQIPDLHAQGVGGAVYGVGSGFRGFHMHIGNISGTTTANGIWKPVLEKLQAFPGMTRFQSRTFNFKNYKDYYEATFPHDEPMMAKQKRHGPGEGDALPMSYGIAHMDTHLLAASHLKSSNITAALKPTAGHWIMIMSAPLPGVGDPTGTSVLPAWRKASVHFVGMGAMAGITTNSRIRDFAPEMGAYGNEAEFDEPDWKRAFWGENYQRLSEFKSKLDPNTLFWVTPGVNADHLTVVDKRVCRTNGTQPVAVRTAIAPASDLQKFASVQVLMERFLTTEMKLGYPEPGKFEGLQG